MACDATTRARRAHPAYWAFVVHRVSGLLLALFLPVHFFALSQALRSPPRSIASSHGRAILPSA